MTYINFGVYFWAFQPFDSELASLAAALPTGTRWCKLTPNPPLPVLYGGDSDR